MTYNPHINTAISYTLPNIFLYIEHAIFICFVYYRRSSADSLPPHHIYIHILFIHQSSTWWCPASKTGGNQILSSFTIAIWCARAPSKNALLSARVWLPACVHLLHTYLCIWIYIESRDAQNVHPVLLDVTAKFRHGHQWRRYTAKAKRQPANAAVLWLLRVVQAMSFPAPHLSAGAFSGWYCVFFLRLRAQMGRHAFVQTTMTTKVII